MAHFATIDASGRATGFYSDAVHSTIPEDAVQVTEAQYQDWINNQQTRAWVNGELTTVTAPPAVVNVAVQADIALVASDRVILRCYEAAVPVPGEWRTYRATLRSIKASDALPSSGMPSAPAYPAGT